MGHEDIEPRTSVRGEWGQIDLRLAPCVLRRSFRTGAGTSAYSRIGEPPTSVGGGLGGLEAWGLGGMASRERRLPENGEPEASASGCFRRCTLATARSEPPVILTLCGSFDQKKGAVPTGEINVECRVWFLTWTTYGTWLPGDRRGFVSNVRDRQGQLVRFNKPGTPYKRDVPALLRAARVRCKHAPVYLTKDQSRVVFKEVQQLCLFRNWQLLAIAIMHNHVHVLVQVAGDPDGADILRDLKTNVSRGLNRKEKQNQRKRWWTRSGSKRCLKTEESVIATASYIRAQHNPLLTWVVPWLEGKL